MRNTEVIMNEFPLFSFLLLKIDLFLCVICLLVCLLLYYFVIRLIRMLLGWIVIQWLFLFSLIEDCWFLLLGQSLRIDLLSLAICFVDVYGAFCFICLFGDWMK